MQADEFIDAGQQDKEGNLVLLNDFGVIYAK